MARKKKVILVESEPVKVQDTLPDEIGLTPLRVPYNPIWDKVGLVSAVVMGVVGLLIIILMLT